MERRIYMDEKIETNKIFCMYCKGELTVKTEQKLNFHKSCKRAISSNKVQLFILEQLQRFSNRDVKHLSISNSLDLKIKSLPENIGLMENADKVEQLTIGHTLIKKIPESIISMEKLKSVDLYKNVYLKKIPDFIFQLKNLEHISYDNYMKKRLPDSISKKIKVIYVFNGILEELPETIGELRDLERLECVSNNLHSLPESFGQLEKLWDLRLDKNKLKTLPESFVNLKNLKELNLNSNLLTELPDVSKLPNLRNIDLNSNKFTEFPKSVCNGKRYQISLGDNNISIFPKEIKHLNYDRLDLYNNNLSDLPELPGASPDDLPPSLYLYNNNFTEIPSTVFKHPRIDILNLDNNKITEIPPQINLLKDLRDLYLSSNQIKTLPEEIGDLTLLSNLNLSNNKLESLPKSILKLKHLFKVDLSNNQLTSLPDLSNNPFLHFLSIKNNKFDKEPNFRNLPKNCKIEITDNVFFRNNEYIKNISPL